MTMTCCGVTVYDLCAQFDHHGQGILEFGVIDKMIIIII